MATAEEKKLARQQERLRYLQRVDPKNKEIKELTKKIGAAPGTPSTEGPVMDADPTNQGTNTAIDMEGAGKFIDAQLDNFKPIDFSGAPKILSANDLEASRQQNQDALYSENTRFLERDRSRDLEEAKQEAANRGLVYDPGNANSIYGKNIGVVNERYAAADKSALDNARAGADQRLGTQVAANKTAYDSFIEGATGQFNSQLDTINTGNSLLNTLMSKYNIDKNTATNLLKIKSEERIARFRQGGSGGGGGSSSGGPIISGDAPGFAV